MDATWVGSAGSLRLLLRALVPAGLTLSLLCPGIALAGHAISEGNACCDCHELKVGYGESDTSFLGTARRSISSIKSARAVAGNNISDEFGCLACHSSPALATKSREPFGWAAGHKSQSTPAGTLSAGGTSKGVASWVTG